MEYTSITYPDCTMLITWSDGTISQYNLRDMTLGKTSAGITIYEEERSTLIGTQAIINAGNTVDTLLNEILIEKAACQ